jgi:hypothetical protein
MRDMAAEQLTRARAAYDDLAGQAARAEAVMEQAALDVAKAACAVLLEEGAKQGLALKKIWEELSRQRDRVTAFADCQIYYADIPFPITLPSETANLLQTLAAIDGRLTISGFLFALIATSKTPRLVEWLSDNGSAYIAKDTLDTATALGLQLCFTPFAGIQWHRTRRSSKPSNATMLDRRSRRMPRPSSRCCRRGSRITMKFTRIQA